MKKILFVATVVKTHIAVFHLPYLEMMKKAGWQVDVAAKNDYENPADCVIPNCDNYYDIAFAREPLRKDNVAAYKALKELIDREQYDMIHCHTPVGGVLSRLAARDARKRGTRVIYTAHGFHFFKGAPLKNWLLYYPIEWLCAHWTDTLITINCEDYERAKKHMHAKRVEYVPGVGIDVDKFANAVVDRAEKRREIGVPEDAFLLLSVGELIHRKNHETIIRALERIKNENIHYAIAGYGELHDYLHDLIINLGMSERVHLLGYRNDIPELYKAADVCALPSFQEGLPVALMEGIAGGLPCIASRIRGNTDLATEQDVLCDPHSVDEFAAAIDRYYHELPPKRDATQMQKFSFETVNKRMREIYGV